MSATRKRAVERDGFVWCYELSADYLRLKLFRLITLGRISLGHIVYIRQRGGSDVAALLRDMLFRPFRTWYWPHPAMSYNAGFSMPYVIRTSHGIKVYVRLRSGYHYRLRDAMGNARAGRRRAVLSLNGAGARGPRA